MTTGSTVMKMAMIWSTKNNLGLFPSSGTNVSKKWDLCFQITGQKSQTEENEIYSIKNR